MMTLRALPILMMLLFGGASAAPKPEGQAPAQDSDSDLKTDASTYLSGGYPNTNYNNFATGYGLLDDKYSPYNGGINGYNGGYNGYSGYSGISGNSGYGYRGYDSSLGYGQGNLGSGGYGGYGGYGGNGGLTSYYGYNNPYYQGSYHTGYGYRKPGNIYNSGITPSLVTGYRGYSRR